MGAVAKVYIVFRLWPVPWLKGGVQNSVSDWQAAYGTPAGRENMRILHLGSKDQHIQVGFETSSSVHSPNLTWDLKRSPLKRILVCNGPLVRFHVLLADCRILVSHVAGWDPIPKGPSILIVHT